MRVEKIEMDNLDKVIESLGRIVEHRKAHPTMKSEELYYDLLRQYFQRLRQVKEEGKYIVGYTVMIPVEIFYAMDIVPMQLEFSAGMVPALLNKQQEYLSTAAGYGLAPETCSGHRMLTAAVIQGALPRPDAIVWSNQVCDNTAKSGDALMELYECPGFFLDRPYRYTEKEFQYFVRELRRLIEFLGDITGQKMDWDKLRETVELSEKAISLIREIKKLRNTIPAPMRNRCMMQQMMIEWYWGGRPEAIKFFQTVRDEIKERVEKNESPALQEQYRLLTLFLPPSYMMKTLDWMEREHGAMSVMEPYIFGWAEGEMDPNKPLESLTHKAFYRSLARQMHGPMADGIVRDAVEEAIDYKAEGAIYWAHIGCRQACATIRSTKDALMEKAGIPTLVIDCDIADPSLTSEEEVKTKLEGFFEILEGLK